MVRWVADNFLWVAKGAQSIVIGLAVGIKLIEPAVGWEGFGVWMTLVLGNAVIRDEKRAQAWLDRLKGESEQE